MLLALQYLVPKATLVVLLFIKKYNYIIKDIMHYQISKIEQNVRF